MRGSDMFEDKYRQEMTDVVADESLIADTLAKMHQEELLLQQDVQPLQTSQPFELEPPKQQTQPERRPLYLRIGLSAAACLLLAVIGVTIFFQLYPGSGQNEPPQYVFHSITVSTTITGGLQFGNVGTHPDSFKTDLEYAECSVEFVPEDIFDADPYLLGSHLVYLGIDRQQNTYYAVCRLDDGSNTWLVLRSNKLSETDFLKAIQAYLH